MELSTDFEIVELKHGGKSLRSLTRKETFHPGIGPVAEARLLHVEQQRLRERAEQIGEFVLWDVGLGAAANAVAAIEALAGTKARLEIHSFDISLAPLQFALGEPEALPYLNPHRELVRALVRDGMAEPAPNIRWHFHAGDFRQTLAEKIPSPHGIFYDPYSPATNREMWTLDHFENLYQRLDPARECLLTTYTRSTAVRVTLLLAGFFVGTGAEIGEKDETTIASNQLTALRRPLPKSWLERVSISRNGSPMRDPVYSVVPIEPADYARLSAHPQFSVSGAK